MVKNGRKSYVAHRGLTGNGFSQQWPSKEHHKKARKKNEESTT